MHRLTHTFLVVSALFISACNAESESPSKTDSLEANAIQFETISVSKAIPSDSSPLGEWQIEHSYPALIEANSKAIHDINRMIEREVEGYSCEGDGDETFTATDVYLDEQILSFHYEAMWHCSTMPSPDSSFDTMTFDIHTGQLIALPDQLSAKIIPQTFIDAVNQTAKPSSDTCAPVSNLQLYTVSDSELKIWVAQGELAPCSWSISKTALAKFIDKDSVLVQ